MKSLARQEVRGIDRRAIESVGVPGVVLMENAGRNAADCLERFLGEAGMSRAGADAAGADGAGAASADAAGASEAGAGAAGAGAAGRSVAIVAGAGNNGGDGYVVARHLAMRGATVTTFLVVPEARIAGDALINLQIIRNLGHDIRRLASADRGAGPQGPGLDRLAEQLRPFDLIVDAVGGTGIRGALRGDMAVAAEQINAAGRPVAAIDIPTGLDCDSGRADGPVIRADITVTFVARKLGFDAPGAAAYTGRVHVVDIGVPADLVAAMPDAAEG